MELHADFWHYHCLYYGISHLTLLVDKCLLDAELLLIPHLENQVEVYCGPGSPDDVCGENFECQNDPLGRWHVCCGQLETGTCTLHSHNLRQCTFYRFQESGCLLMSHTCTEHISNNLMSYLLLSSSLWSLYWDFSETKLFDRFLGPLTSFAQSLEKTSHLT